MVATCSHLLFWAKYLQINGNFLHFWLNKWELPETIFILIKNQVPRLQCVPGNPRQNTYLRLYLKSKWIKMASMTNKKNQTAIAILVCFLAFFASHHLLGRTP